VNTKTRSATTVGHTADYQLDFVWATRMLSDSKITIVFPLDQVTYDTSTKCFTDSTDLSWSLTTVDSSTFKTELTQWCNSGAECAAGTTIKFTLKDAINPGWVVDPLSSTVTITTTNTQLSSATIDDITSGIQFTSSLVPGTIVDYNVVKGSSTKVGDSTTYSLTFTPVTNIPANGQILLTFPSSAVYKASGTAVVWQDGSSNSKTCTSTEDSSNNIQTITVTDLCTSACNKDSSLTINLSSVYNPGSTKPISTSFQVATQTNDPYAIDTGTAASTSGFGLVYNDFTSVTVNAPTGTIANGEIVEYQFTIVLKNGIPATGGSLVITFPSEIAVQSSGSCTAVISSTNHVCSKSSTDNTVTVTFSSDTTSGSSLVVTITNGVK
jgi:hypothetical protein